MIEWRQQISDKKQKIVGIICLIVAFIVYTLLIIPYGFVRNRNCGRIDYLASLHTTLTMALLLTCSPHRFYGLFGKKLLDLRPQPFMDKLFDESIVLAIGYATSSMTIRKCMPPCDFRIEPMYVLEGDLFTLASVISMLLSMVYIFYWLFKLCRLRQKTPLDEFNLEIFQIFKKLYEPGSVNRFISASGKIGNVSCVHPQAKKLSLYFLMLYFSWEIKAEDISLFEEKSCLICKQGFSQRDMVTIPNAADWSHWSCLSRSEMPEAGGSYLSTKAVVRLLETLKTDRRPAIRDCVLLLS